NMFGLKRFFEKMTHLTPPSSGAISEEAERKAAAFMADMDKMIIMDMRSKGYALADPANNLSLDELVAIHAAEREAEIKIEVDRVAPATITFDPDTNRATDAASGMAVEYVADDYPLESREFWRLIWLSSVHDFSVSRVITRQEPDSGISERSESTGKYLWKYEVPVACPNDAKGFLSNIDLFLDLFASVLRNRLKSRDIDIVFKRWGVEPKY